MRFFILKKKAYSPKWHWDCAYGFIVEAESYTAARRIAADKCGDEGPDAWLSPEHSTCQLLKLTDEPRVIMRDFLNG